MIHDMKKKIFEKADTKYKNIRNAVGGLITSKKSFNKEFSGTDVTGTGTGPGTGNLGGGGSSSSSG